MANGGVSVADEEEHAKMSHRNAKVQEAVQNITRGTAIRPVARGRWLPIGRNALGFKRAINIQIGFEISALANTYT